MTDWPGIEALRDACYARWKMPVQERDGLYWLISTLQNRIVAAVGYAEEADTWSIYDWYAEDTRWGKRGTSAILRMLLQEADTQEKTIYGISCFSDFIAHAMKRGFKFQGIAIYRMPGGQICQD